MSEGKRVNSWVTLVLGAILFVLGVLTSANGGLTAGIIPLGIGLTLIYLGWRGGRIATLVFGHIAIALGCYMVTWGIYLLPHSDPTVAHIFGRPLFWGLFSIFGGLCANYHGFCKCITKKA